METKNERRKKRAAKSFAHFSRANNLWCSQHKQFVIVESGTREWGQGAEKHRRRVRTKCETNFRRLNIELRILGMLSFFIHPSSSTASRWPPPPSLRWCSQVAYSFCSTFKICSLFHFGSDLENAAYTMCVPLRNESFTRVRNKQKRRKDTP